MNEIIEDLKKLRWSFENYPYISSLNQLKDLIEKYEDMDK